MAIYSPVFNKVSGVVLAVAMATSATQGEAVTGQVGGTAGESAGDVNHLTLDMPNDPYQGLDKIKLDKRLLEIQEALNGGNPVAALRLINLVPAGLAVGKDATPLMTAHADAHEKLAYLNQMSVMTPTTPLATAFLPHASGVAAFAPVVEAAPAPKPVLAVKPKLDAPSPFAFQGGNAA